MNFDEGPCVRAALADTIVRADDFRAEPRWPQYSPAVVEIGVLSGLSFKLYTADQTSGALNLFGFEPRTWDADAESVGSVLAAHAAAAIVGAQARTPISCSSSEPRPNRPGKGNHHGALRRGRRARIPDAAPTKSGTKH